jgi:SAM domain (Sterile alpha motif)
MHLTDQDLEKLGVLLGHRRKLLRAIAALDGTPAATSMPPPPTKAIPGAIPAQVATASIAETAGASRRLRRAELECQNRVPFGNSMAKNCTEKPRQKSHV